MLSAVKEYDALMDMKKRVTLRGAKYDNYHALNYDRWEICLPACELGRKTKLPLYKFLKDPLIRKFGKKWYNKLCNTIEKPKEKIVKNP